MNSITEQIEKLVPTELESLLSIFDFSLVDRYHLFLDKYNLEGGFFSKKDTTLIIPRHIVESLLYTRLISKVISVSRETTICDVGTGPGLPGIFFSFLKEAPHITLLDSQRRKLALLENEIRTWNISKNIYFVYDRVEDHKLKYNAITMRSTIPYPWSMEMVSHILKNDGYFFPFIGKKTTHQDIEKSIKLKMNLIEEDEIFMNELNFLGERRVKVLKKLNNTNSNKARLWKDIQKEIRQYNG
jgi:16S rRNA (guanine527-N7)-methyltransferase